MEINVLTILVIIVLAGLAYYANSKLNSIPMLKNVIDVLIVVVAVLLLLQSMDLIGGQTTIRVN